MEQTQLNTIQLEEAKKKMQDSRKRALRFNILLSLFFIVIITGLTGAIFYYNRINKLYEENNTLNGSLTKAIDSIKILNTTLESIAIDYKQSINTGNTTGVSDTVKNKVNRKAHAKLNIEYYSY